MKKSLIFVAIVVAIATNQLIAGEPELYKVVRLSDGTPAILRLSDSSLVEIGTVRIKRADTLFTDVYRSTPEGYFMYDWKYGYFRLINPGELPVSQWGFNRVVVDFSGYKKGVKILFGVKRFFLRDWIRCDIKDLVINNIINTRTPSIDDPSVAGKKAFWVWEPNPKGWKAGHLEFRDK